MDKAEKQSQSFDINNRKYLGSKYRLLDFIDSVVIKNCGKKIDVFLDIFSGTGVVANHFRKYSKKIIANDLLYSNYIINKVFLNSTKNNVSIKKVEKIIKNLNELKGVYGYCYKNFSNSYFTEENSALIDSIREKINYLLKTKKITKQEYYVLLTSLLFALDKVANTVGQYDAFLKHINSNISNNEKHLVDRSVYKRLTLKMPIIYFDGINEIYNKDANILIKKIECDVLYLDPPYNNRQYIDCYHILENIMRWEKPKVYGKTKKFERELLKSNYSKKSQAVYTFENLISNAKCNHIFLSYNNEGIIPDSEIVRILKNKGELKIYKKNYQIFGNGAGNSKKRSIIERIFYCKVK